MSFYIASVKTHATSLNVHVTHLLWSKSTWLLITDFLFPTDLSNSADDASQVSLKSVSTNVVAALPRLILPCVDPK